MKRSEIFLLLVLSAVLAGWFYNFQRVNKRARATYVAYYIPEGYAGWVTVKFNIKKSPPIPFITKGDGGIYKILVPKDGVFLTSSPFYAEKHRTRYYHAGKNGFRLMLEGGFGVKRGSGDLNQSWISGGSYNASYLQFYVFPKPVPHHTHPPEPAGRHLIAGNHE